MVDIQNWIAFALAVAVILVIPGPTIILVISQAITHGRRSVIPLAAGVVCGDFTAMALSILGLGAVLSASAVLFSILKWTGAIYLFFLGIKLWRADPGDEAVPLATTTGRRLFRSSYVVTALNPKSIAFFVAFLPQFIDRHQPSFPQLAVLGATFLILAGVNAALYGIFAGRLRDAMKSGRVRRWFNRCGGSALIAAGAFTAAMHRSS